MTVNMVNDEEKKQNDEIPVNDENLKENKMMT